MPSQAVINDEIADLSLVVVYDAANGTALPYDRTVNGQVLSFYHVESNSELPVAFMDVETRSRWDMRGRASGGPSRREPAATGAGVQLDVVRLEYVLAGDDDMGDR